MTVKPTEGRKILRMKLVSVQKMKNQKNQPKINMQLSNANMKIVGNVN